MTDRERERLLFNKMIAYYAGNPKRIQHFIKVYEFARLIGEGENLPEKEQRILNTAAIVHDIGIKAAEAKYHSTMGKYQEEEGAPLAQTLLQECGCDPDLTRRVCFLVAHHHTYTNIESGDYQILVEADFLVNLYEHSSKYGSAETAKVKIFKTATGTRLLEQMFLTKPC